MLIIWSYTLISVVVVSLISFVGILFISINDDLFKKLTLYLVSFSCGALFGDTFIHILPGISGEQGLGLNAALLILTGIVLFFVMEKFVSWRHCHIKTSEGHPHPVAYTNLVGDGLHNFIDGMIIAGSFIASIPVGIATTIAVVLHEIPAEIGEFSILVHAGFSKKKALICNFLSATTAILGAVATLLAANHITGLPSVLLPLTAGGFIYIAGSDLIPELHKECHNAVKSLFQLLAILAGIATMMLLLFVD